MSRLKKWGKRLRNLIIFLVLFVFFLEWWLSISPPEIKDTSAWELQRTEVAKNFYQIDKNWIKKNEYGLWEAYVEGEPFERGAILGNLAKELIVLQEVYFVQQINNLVPSNAFLYLLRYMVGFFNRNLDEYIPLEYQKEIYGETHFGSDEYNSIGSNYERILNYHAAHDIGHALNDYAVVGCTAFSTWDKKSKDGNLIIGRNFDFYVGDDFAKDKMVLFINPTEGYKFASITWGGFLGVASGMNEKGLTVSLNAAKSGIPSSAKTPISIVAREILQYAKNIEEAFEIAKKFETFVSESILIGSAEDGLTAIIEKSVDKTALYYSDSSNYIICSNHYQSDSFKTDKDNIDNIAHTSSNYRQKRTLELLNENGQIDYNKAAKILRDRKGLGGVAIGMGNEKTLNQMQGHHSVIFMPEQRLMWVSTSPYQLGAFLAYDLNEIFNLKEIPSMVNSLFIDSLLIEEDSFIYSKDFENYTEFRYLKADLKKLTTNGIEYDKFDEEKALRIIDINPNYYQSYELSADFFKAKQRYESAILAYKKALEKEIPTLADRNSIIKKLEETKGLNRNQN